MPRPRNLRPYRQGGMPEHDTRPGQPHRDPSPKHPDSIAGGDAGTGREGLSKGYGGSAGDGTGASGPDSGGPPAQPAERPPQDLERQRRKHSRRASRGV